MPPDFRFLSHLGKSCFQSEIEAVGLIFGHNAFFLNHVCFSPELILIHSKK